MHAARATDLRTLGHIGIDVVTHANRSLDLLRAIEDTIDALRYERDFFEVACSNVQQAISYLTSTPPKKRFDPDGSVEDKLYEAQRAIRKLYKETVTKRNAAKGDPRLIDEDGVLDGYTDLIAIIAELHNSLNELRWLIGANDADFEKPSGQALSTPAEIEGFLDSL